MVVSLFLLALFGLLTQQFFRTQILEHEKWLAKANAQHQVVIQEPAMRGRFFSNTEIKQGHPNEKVAFVLDVPYFRLYIDPQSIPKQAHKEISSALCRFLNMTQVEEIKHLREQFEKKSRSRKIAGWLDAQLKEEIQKWWFVFSKSQKIASNAIYFIQDFRRCYPFGKLLGQVLHTVREQREEKTQKSIPTGGLEFVLDEYLQGKVGKRVLDRSPHHEMGVGHFITIPEDGADILLTVNHCLQTIAEEEIERQVIQSQAKGGWVIIMNPYTGEILSLAQYPFFDPKEYPKFFNDAILLEHAKVKAITDPYEPGSTMKAITIALSLLANEELKKRGERPLFDPEEKISTIPTLFPGRSRPLKDINRNNQFLNMHMAIQKSSNVYMAKLVERIIDRLGANWYRYMLQEIFGFGVKTGIELPAESPGLLPTPGKLHPNGKLEWSQPTPYSLAMGHNILVNSLQMVRSFAIIANGGYDVKPTLVKRIIRGNEIIYDLHRKLLRKPPRCLLDLNIARQVTEAMKYVTQPGGSAAKADIPHYTEAGKTSTSEKIVNGTYSKKDHISTFLGFAPAEHPCFVMIIVLDEPARKVIPGIGANQFGGNCAAPVFSRIGERILQYLGIEPDDPDNQKTKLEAEGLKKLYDEWNEK